MKFIIETTKLTKRYGKQISVKGLNLAVPTGSIFGFLGPNGAGKTTTIRMLLGLIHPTEGTAFLFGKSISTHRREILENVGSLVESPSYYGHLSGYDNLKIIATLRNVPTKQIDEVLALVRLSKDANKKAKHYSLGMKQRLGIAAALLGNPQLLILDEPTNGLDPAGIQEIRELILTIPRQTGATILISSHLLSEVEQIATHVGVIHQGSCIFQDTLANLQATAGKRLEIMVNNPTLAHKLLHDKGWEVEHHNELITTNQIEKERTAQMISQLVQHDFSVYRVTEVSGSLEQIFLEMTGKEDSL
jgi:ABC-type multidrug transport system ATPase subunit